MTTDLPETLLQFVQAFVPTYQAAEMLLFCAGHPGVYFSPEEIVSAMRPVVITVPAGPGIRRALRRQRLAVRAGGRYSYGPSPELERGVGELASAYTKKPVTLIRAIYRIADTKLQSFADAFKLREDES